MNSVGGAYGGMPAGPLISAHGNSALLAQGQLSPQEVGEEFEALFMTQLVKEMRETVGEEGMFSGAADAYGGLFDMFMGRHLAKAGGLGVQQFIQQYLRTESDSKTQA